MITLKHAIKISAGRSVVYRALTEMEGLRRWHTGSIEGSSNPGMVLTLTSDSGKRFSWRVIKLETNISVVQTSVEVTENSIEKILSFTLSDLEDNRTLVELAHGEWLDDDPHLPFCNTHWGEALHNLKLYLEKL